MTLNSIKGDRLFVYVNRENNELRTDETPNASLVQFNDILQERN